MKALLLGSLQRVQSVLSFESWAPNAQFANDRGLGRIATLALLLGILWGLHFSMIGVLLLHHFYLPIPLLANLLGEARVTLLLRWCIYIVVLSTFHLLEFFTTVIFNPTVAVSESFLVNHSIGYTGAFLTSCTEFWIRFLLFPSFQNGYATIMGLILVVLAQMLRSLAMCTAGESFNHRIQTSKKDNHVLVTDGIYSYLRHPSYAGFYYWAIGTQLLLNNALHTFLFAIASTLFFRKRIPYEEESLIQYFPHQYPAYRERTWIGIPFVPTVDLHKTS